MATYIVRRLLIAIPILFGITILIFAVRRLWRRATRSMHISGRSRPATRQLRALLAHQLGPGPAAPDPLPRTG